MDITHDNVCSSMLSCFYSHLLSTGRPISSSSMHSSAKRVLQISLSSIFRSAFLGNIKEAFDKNPDLMNLLLDDFFKSAIHKCQVSSVQYGSKFTDQLISLFTLC